MEDYTAALLRQKARLRLPDIKTEAGEYLVAVSAHNKTAESCEPTDFTWFKCRAKHTVAKIRGFYMARENCQADMYFGRTILEESATISKLDRYGDRLIVFRAVETGVQAAPNAYSPGGRSPLQPKNCLQQPKSEEATETVLEHFRDPKRTINFSVAPAILSPSRFTNNNGKPTPGVDLPAPSPMLQAQSILQKKLIPDEYVNSIKSGERIAGGMYPNFQRNQHFVPFAQPSHQQHFSPVTVKQEETPRINALLSSAYSPVHKIEPATVSLSHVAVTAPALLDPPVERPSMLQNTNALIQRLLAEATPEILEDEVRNNLHLIDQLQEHLSPFAIESTEAQQWLLQIDNLRKQNVNEPTIIGVVGNTGAGKSSVINAMLDEERLVPTNCMRACTAVVTEISWNSSNDENAKYRAEIEFIQSADWEKELRILFEELLDGNGKVSRDSSNEDSEAGIAYAKIKAVYPGMTKDDIAKSNVAELMLEPGVRAVLGTTKTVEEARSSQFYRILQTFVDSKEKSKPAGEKKKQKREMEYWPLIKVVKIYTKADALSTGAVVVDLPGVHDSNAARSAIAQNYMKICTGLWIVAPITRAVDDKAAKSLLGESFKRQLKFDGKYSRVTFICSKTDDISITEASDSLGLGEEMSSKWDHIDRIEKDTRQLKQDVKELQESKTIYLDVMNDTEDQLEIWDKLKEDLDGGKTVYAPGQGAKKRKRVGGAEKQRKKTTAERSSDDDNYDSIDDDASDDDVLHSDAASQREPLTLKIIEAKIAEIKSTKKEARLQRRELDVKIVKLQEEVAELASAQDEIDARMSAQCIAGRNKYSKGAIQSDFADGIRELDQENRIEEDEATFDPEEVLRDYEEVARSLPVFCVSSRAYQKLCGRLQRDNNVPGFNTVEETEIPQLQAHCKKLTEAGRVFTSRRFLNAVNQFLNSLSLWVCNDGGNSNLSDLEMANEAGFLQMELDVLKEKLEESVERCLERMEESISENIYNKFSDVIAKAVDKANATAKKWGAPLDRQNTAKGGLHWATYKAVCRRDGVYNGARGLLDFNGELTEPIMRNLSSHWEKAFASRLPHDLQDFTKRTEQLLSKFHDAIYERAIANSTSIASMLVLKDQLQSHTHAFRDLTQGLVQVIGEHQREANRRFTPVIAEHLLSAYEYCTAERGTGSYLRMKEHMTSHIDTSRNTMFHRSTEDVKNRLKQMCGLIEEQMSNKADDVFTLMRTDYMRAIHGAHIPKGQEMPDWELTMKAAVKLTIQEREKAAAEGVSDEEVNSEAGEKEIKPDTNQMSNPSEIWFAESRDAEQMLQAELNESIKEESWW